MTKKKLADKTQKRVPLEDLLDQMTRRAEGRSGGQSQKGTRIGSMILNQSVYSFYAACLAARGVGGVDEESIQDWIADCIEVTLGEKSTKRLSMRELANRIAEAIDAEDINPEDRWALYELCFMLTAEMGGVEVRRFKRADLSSRRGTPGEPEPRSLYKRAFGLLTDRDFRQRQEELREGRLTLEQLLLSMDSKITDCPPFAQTLSIREFVDCCMYERNHTWPSGELDVCSCMMDEQRFFEAARLYGGDVCAEGGRVKDFVVDITVGYLYKSKEPIVQHHEVLQAYELCYEFINLMADAEHCGRHRSMMQAENLPADYDIDMKRAAELEADIETATELLDEYEKMMRNEN